MGVAEALVIGLAVPGLYLLLFILTKIEQWLEAGTRPAGAPEATAPGGAVVAQPGAAAQAGGTLRRAQVPPSAGPVPALEVAESAGTASRPGASPGPDVAAPGVVASGLTGEAA